MILLSICIPTFNRCREIIGTLDSVVTQLNDDLYNKVEIVISDNASTDETQKYISEYILAHKAVKIKYHRNNKNIGFDKNVLTVIELSEGEYCWFMGSDDQLAKDSLSTILSELRSHYTIYLFNRYNCFGPEMKIIEKESFLRLHSDEVFTFQNVIYWSYYISLCKGLGGLFSYMSSIVFERSKYICEAQVADYLGTDFIHTALCLIILSSNINSTVRYLDKPLVLNRIGNDSFFINQYQRIMLNFNSFIKFSNIFKNNIISNAVLDLLKRAHPTIGLRVLLQTNSKEFNHLIETMQFIGYTDLEIDLLKDLKKHKLYSAIILAERFFSKKFNQSIIKHKN